MGLNNLAFFDLFLAVFLGVICNRFLRYKGFPIFNPAALAVLVDLRIHFSTRPARAYVICRYLFHGGERIC
ncbi:MAG: hypothetical protein KatS3mg083_358 [Candidatus Dojkabacteria bacterium]|nr:MAG: hypothetical protein KatS3mg083_358 [Candidatus Dojkabacteria bacterium]